MARSLGWHEQAAAYLFCLYLETGPRGVWIGSLSRVLFKGLAGVDLGVPCGWEVWSQIGRQAALPRESVVCQFGD